MRPFFCQLWLLVLLAPALVLGDDHAQQREFFEKKIRPVLVTHCYSCHSSEAADKGKLKGGLRLDNRAAVLAGGESGPALVPGKPAASRLLRALQFADLEMPPEGKLPAAVIADFEQWIAAGAFDPREETNPQLSKVDPAKGKDFWSFQPLVKHPLPRIQDTAWPKNDIDYFVLAKLEANQLSPTPAANDRLLLRRLYFDLIGLPPTPAEMNDYLQAVAADREVAWEKVVERLLASPHFGERWGRHWLDVVHFAESNGRDQNIVWHHAWRYRAYVIEAFNHDKPFDQFIREQVAGDLLPHKTRAERDAAITATGVFAMAPKNIDEANKALYRMDLIDDQIDVLSKAFLGLSISCARCHDHKFEPIPTADYYALAGIFGSTDPLYGPARWGTKGTLHKHYFPIGEQAETLGPSAMAYVKELEQTHQDLIQGRVDRYRVVRKVADLKNQLQKPGADKEQLTAHITKMEAEILEWDAEIKTRTTKLEEKIANPPPQPDWVLALREVETPQDMKIHVRGETTNLRESVPRGVPQLISIPDLPAIQSTESGRRQLAEWLASPKNPLTPRVAVNRVWQHLFGRGLVATVDDFGHTGSPPSHPELLDHLATQWLADGWSLKSLIRRIVLSQTYRQGSEVSQTHQERDAENTLLGRMSRKRLEIEPFRDAILAVSGQLDRQPPSQPFLARYAPYRHHTWSPTNSFVKPAEMEFPHRSVYLPVLRGVLPEPFTLFDFADPNRVVGERGESTVPAQALFLLNSPWILQRSREAAQFALAQPDQDDRQRIIALYERMFSRPPTDDELNKLSTYLQTSITDRSEEQLVAAWTRVCQVLFGSAEFRILR